MTGLHAAGMDVTELSLRMWKQKNSAIQGERERDDWEHQSILLFCFFGCFYFFILFYACFMSFLYATHQTCGKLESQPYLDICKISFTFDLRWRMPKGNTGKFCKLDGVISRHPFQRFVTSGFFPYEKIQGFLQLSWSNNKNGKLWRFVTPLGTNISPSKALL